jgi:phosphotransferase system  glucose/maltose/N-acetylglucosamine-specific IIC component
MGDDKIKIGDVEGAKDAVLDFIKESGADIPSLLNVPMSIKVPFWSIVCSAVIFMALVCVIAVVGLSENAFRILSLISIAMGTILAALIYMAYRSKVLASIVAFGEVVLLSISLGIYSPKEAIGKIGEKLENIISK